MSVLAFDTHAFVQRLHAVGFSQEQAEVVTQLQQEVVNATLGQVHSAELVTKQDLRKMELALKRDLKELDLALKQDLKELDLALKHDLRGTELKLELKIAETNTKIAETKSELIRWIVGAGFLQTALITALLLKMSSGL
ncbi:MAG: DUF1640 domain-containing protein [Methyloprofundus sp.]|nr:DUF1640 domain-containing protein [Methyloprofundus sp.]MDT8425680.1 DUF1640 domain-containing protein [Methyloprofundus sp.]